MGQRIGLEQRLQDDFRGVDKERLASFGRFYRGKVRDMFIGEEEILMITTDRLSAFDVVLTSVPCKGAILNAITLEAFEATKDICQNHLLESVHPNVMRVKRAEPVKAEIIVRRYITGSLWRDYQAGSAGVYDLDFPADLKRDQKFDSPIITPSTKEDIGEHDQPISIRGLKEAGLVEGGLLEELCRIAVKLFERGEKVAAQRGLILVDTKYEFGIVNGEIHVIDEIHTADSSRYWLADQYEACFKAGEPQKMLDKENIRQWLIGQGYQGEGTPPVIPDEVRLGLAEKYISLHDLLIGTRFDASALSAPSEIYRRLGLE